MTNILLYDSVNDGEDISLTAEYRLIISSNGQVNFIPGLKWVTSCKVDLRYFPYDKQQCNISLVNWSYGKSLKFVALEPYLALYEENDDGMNKSCILVQQNINYEPQPSTSLNIFDS